MLRSMNDLYGFTIGATDGDIGTVKEAYFDDVSHTVRYVVVDTLGWLSERKVLLSPIAFRAMDWAYTRITAALTKAQVEKSPDIDTDKPVSGGARGRLLWLLWLQPVLGGVLSLGRVFLSLFWVRAGPSAADLEHERRWNWETKERGDPHLRSSRAVTGYHIQAKDGDVGHVADFLVDDYSWAIRYMIADTSNWWLGKKVLVATAWIKRVDWDHSELHVTVTRAQIKNCPEYDPARPVERTYETQLYGHSGQPRDWDEWATTASRVPARARAGMRRRLCDSWSNLRRAEARPRRRARRSSQPA